jgi:hypothetical protein
MEKIYSTSSFHIDPDTGEVQEHTPYRRKNLGEFYLNTKNLVIIVFLGFLFHLSFISYVYWSISKELRYTQTQFDSLFEGVKESERNLDEMKESLQTMQQELNQIVADEEEFRFENFWGNNESAAHLQSMKYLGYYIFNGQMIAHTKSVQGNRYLRKGESIGDNWKVSEITTLQILLEGEEGKTFSVQKEHL